MLRKQSDILIFDRNTGKAKFKFDIVTSVEIIKDRRTFTDTATLIFPNRLRRKENLIDNINIGDKVVINLGYFPNLVEEFEGFISFVDKNSPLVLKLEDQSFQLKRKSLSATTLKNTTIKELIETFFDGETNILDAEIGDWRIAENATLINILDELKSKLGVLSNFKNGVLNVNTELIVNEETKVIKLNINGEEGNVVQGSDDLNFQKDTDIGIISHGISIQKSGIKIEVFATYKENLPDNEIIVSNIKPIGVLNTLKVPDLSLNALTKLIKQRLPKLFYTGITGKITTFGAPSINHGDIVHLTDERTPERNGKYKIDAVTKNYDNSIGYKQTLTLGLKVGKL
ncbi:MAG: hypothetical protein QQN41_09330 [Nitrosopumilus sp.]